MNLTNTLWHVLGGMMSPPGRRARLSILMFHSVVKKPDPLDDTIDAEMFDSVMGFLAESFNVLPLPEAIQLLYRNKLPARSVCITFDDGYVDNNTVALPILEKWGMPATFFIATGFLDGGRMWNDTVIEIFKKISGSTFDLTNFDLGVLPIQNWEQRRHAMTQVLTTLKPLQLQKRKDCVNQLLEISRVEVDVQPMMTKTQVRELHNRGMDIGGHTVNHPILCSMSEQEAWTEIITGKEEIEGIIGGTVKLFAYPNGKPGVDYDCDHVKLVKAAGFNGAVNTSWGAATASSDYFQLPRFTPWDKNNLRFGARLLLNCRRSGEVV